MGSLENTLLPGEKIIARANLSPLPLFIDWGLIIVGAAAAVAGLLLLAMVPLGIGLLILGGIGLLFGIGRLLRTLLIRKTTEMVVTSRRVLVRVGVLSKEVEEMLLSKVESVEVDQKFWQRLLDVGTIHVHGSGEGRLDFTGISKPHAFRKSCLTAVQGGENKQAEAPQGRVYEVRINDGSGDRWIEVRAETPAQAVALAQQAGVKAGEARLRRID